jgi:hypothetical protein
MFSGTLVRQGYEATLPSFPLRTKLDFPSWESRVMRLLHGTGLSPILTEHRSWASDRVAGDEALKAWLLAQLPEYLQDLLVQATCSSDLWRQLKEIMLSCPLCTDYRKISGTLHQLEGAAVHGCVGCLLVMQVLRLFNSPFVQTSRSKLSRDVLSNLSKFDALAANGSFELSAKVLSAQGTETAECEEYCLSAINSEHYLDRLSVRHT